MNPITTIDIDGFTTISEIADVLPVHSYKKLESDSQISNNSLKFFIKKNISVDDNVGLIGVDSDLDYAIFNSSEPIFYISFILNSKFGFNSIGKTNQLCRVATVSLGRIKDTIIPLNDHMDDCCYFEKIHIFIKDYYLSLEENEENKDTFLFLLNYLYLIKSYMILEMFKPEIFREFNFSILNAWRIEREIMGNEIPNIFLVKNLLKNLFSGTNELTMDIDRLSVIGTHYDFSPIF